MRLEDAEEAWSRFVIGVLELNAEMPGVLAWILAIVTVLVCGCLTVAYLILKYIFFPRKY